MMEMTIDTTAAVMGRHVILSCGSDFGIFNHSSPVRLGGVGATGPSGGAAAAAIAAMGSVVPCSPAGAVRVEVRESLNH